LRRLLSAVLLVDTPLVSNVGKRCLLVPEIAIKMQRSGSVSSARPRLLVNTPLVRDVGKKCLLVPEIAIKMQRSGCVGSARPRTTTSNVNVASNAFLVLHSTRVCCTTQMTQPRENFAKNVNTHSVPFQVAKLVALVEAKSVQVRIAKSASPST